jgi:hypothetical protein
MPDLTLSAAMDSFLAEANPATVFLPISGGTMNGTLNVDLILSSDGARQVDLYNGSLVDSVSNSVEWANHQLVNTGGVGGTYGLSLNWSLRQLIENDGTTVAIDWSSTPNFPGGLTTYGATLTPMAVASLVGNEGTIAYVNDALSPIIGSTVVGGSSAKCLVCYNGMNWIVTATL